MPDREDNDAKRREQERRDFDARLEQQRENQMQALATRIGNLSDNFIRYEERQIRMALDVTAINQKMDERSEKLDEEYVRRSEFEPIQRLVWRCIYTAATIIIGGLITLAIRAGGVIK